MPRQAKAQAAPALPPIGSTWKAGDGRIVRVAGWGSDFSVDLVVLNATGRMRPRTSVSVKHFSGRGFMRPHTARS